MTVKQLIAKIQKLDPDALVVQARDGEGNGYSPLDSVTEERYIKYNKRSGDLADPDSDNGESVKAVVLWPRN